MWPEFAVRILSVAEMAGLVLAGFLLFRYGDYSLAEAAAYALFLPLMAFSFCFQIAFLTGGLWMAPTLEAGLVALAGYGIYRLRNQLRAFPREIFNFVKIHPLATTVLTVGWLFLANKALIADVAFQGCHEPLSLSGPGNSDLLCHFWNRFSTNHGYGIFGFMAYLTIGFATYALARRYAWPSTAITVTLIVMSMPRLVYLVTAANTEIHSAAAAVFSVLAIYRTIEQPNPRDLALLLWGILFGISGQILSIVFPVILVPLCLILMYRRHGFQTWWSQIRRHRLRAGLALIPAFVFSSLTWWLKNLGDGTTGGIFSHFETPPLNPDGIIGTVANMSRYLLESVHLTRPVAQISHRVFGVKLVDWLQGIHDGPVAALFADQGAVAPFKIAWAAGTDLSWFGPFAFFLILPAILYALFKASRRLKAVAVALLGYFYLMALIPAWMPGNARLFTLFFATGGFFVAFLLPPWRLSRRQKSLLQMLNSILFFHALLA
jgi:hypothetical protein